VITTPRIDSLMARLRELESSGGYIILPDGTRFKVEDSGILMLFNQIKLRRDLGREPLLSDFSEDEQERWRNYSKWTPNPAQHGQISILLTNMAKKLVD